MSGKAPVQLVPRSPQPGFPEIYDLTEVQTTIGRHPSNTIVLPFESISRFHARIDRRGDYYIVQDLNSSNGSYVNSERITQMTLHNGDTVTFGNVEFLFNNEASQSGLSTHSSARGKDIVDILDDKESPAPMSTSVIRAEQIAKERSSVISNVDDRKADKSTLMRLNTRLRTLYKLSELLRENANEAESAILEKVLDLIFDAISADRAVVMTRYSADAQQLDVSAVKYRDRPIVPQKVSVSRTILEQVLTQKVAILSKDAMADERFGASESIIMSQTRSTLCVPMMMDGRVMGVLHMDTSSTSKNFNEEDLEFATIIATETAVALENLRMRKAAIHRERLAAVGETVAGISHNVKNILLLSQGGAELLTRAMDKDDLESARESWGVVKRGIDKIGALVRDMLEYSANKKLELKSVDINALIYSIAEEVEPQLVAKNVMLEVEMDDTVGERMIDQLGLQRTVYNILTNAMEAISHNEGRILISSSVGEDDRLILLIRDNGYGIPQDKLEKIWFPFFTTKGSTGTGLGLPMCKKCIEDMGGTIDCESEENSGTSFIIQLPRDIPERAEE